MRFRLTDDQLHVQDAMRRIANEPGARDRQRAVIAGREPVDATLWHRLGEFGAFGLVVPVGDGGAGATMVELSLVAEQLGAAAACVPFLGHVLTVIAVVGGGDAEQRARWLPDLLTGRSIGTVAFAEGDGIWEPRAWTVAGETEFSGRKINVPNASQADLILVGVEGGDVVMVESSDPGVSIRDMVVNDLTRPLGVVDLDRARGTRLVDSLSVAERVRDAGLVLLAADAFGGASRSIEMIVEYTLQREVFERKLAEFQAVKHQLADMALEVEPTRGLFWFAAYAFDALQEQASHAAALAKAQICDVYIDVSRRALELYGGLGFTWDHDAHVYMKRAQFDFAWGGRPSIHFNRAADLAGW